MSYKDHLTQTCTINSITQERDTITYQTVEKSTAIYSNIKCLRATESYARAFQTDKLGFSYTDLFYCEYLENMADVDDVGKRYIIVHGGIEYEVKKAIDPGNKHHHTEIYTDIIT